jgi:hypothetical protein
VSRRALDEVVAVVYAVACLAAVLAPALAVHWAATQGGMGDLEGADLVAASTLVGAGQAVVAWARLRAEERTAVRRIDMWIAAGNALVILTLGATVLLLLVLHGFPDEHASMARRGYPVVALWTGVQLVAVALAELTGRVMFWWLEPHAPTRGLCHWSVVPWRRRRAATTCATGPQPAVPAVARRAAAERRRTARVPAR